MFRKIPGALVCFTLVAVSQHAAAMDLSATLGQDMFSLSASRSLSPTLSVGGQWYKSEKHRGTSNAYRAFVAFQPRLPTVDLTISARYQYLDTRFGDGGHIGIGASAYVPTLLPRLSIGGHVDYYPDSLSHGDVDTSYEYGVGARLRLLSNTYVTGGYRYFTSEFNKPGKRKLDSGWMLGVNMGF